jgi:hypothetical protein
MKGLFYCQDSETLSLLRFYNNFTVIGVSTYATLNEIQTVLKWFNKENSNKNFSEGIYTLIGDNKIIFDLKGLSGIVSYTGEILNNQNMHVQVHSHINNFKHQKTYIHYNSKISITTDSAQKKVMETIKAVDENDKQFNNMIYELVEIYYAIEKGFSTLDENEISIKTIGEQLNKLGGLELMQKAHADFSLQCEVSWAPRNLEHKWNGIGQWLG